MQAIRGRGSVTFEIVCGGCGATVYSGVDLKPARDILRLTGQHCRKCGALLSDQDFGIEVKPLPS